MVIGVSLELSQQQGTSFQQSQDSHQEVPCSIFVKNRDHLTVLWWEAETHAMVLVYVHLLNWNSEKFSEESKKISALKLAPY